MTTLVIGLLAVVSATTTTALIRKKAMEEEAIFAGMQGRLDWARSQLYSDTPFHNAAMASLAVGPDHVQSDVLDADQDGVQDLSYAIGDAVTPILSLTVTSPIDPGDPTILVQVDVSATWYGVSGNRTKTLGMLVSNREGYNP